MEGERDGGIYSLLLPALGHVIKLLACSSLWKDSFPFLLLEPPFASDLWAPPHPLLAAHPTGLP